MKIYSNSLHIADLETCHKHIQQYIKKNELIVIDRYI